ncbi:MAG: hypothetical protein IKO01_00400 [Kiritimatiellae bacterium]|nr:hypothetical protein [Kiritimatiellia bacterium]
MSTDFYDDDIIPSSREIPSRPISDLPLTHMARHKQEVDERMVDKAKELERLRSRQAELERERRTLEELRAQQERFETLRRDSKKTLSESLVRLDQERQQADRLIEQLEETRRLFQSRLEEVDGIDEQSWEDDRLPDELNRAVVLLESVQDEYRKAVAKLDAIRPATGAAPASGRAAPAYPAMRVPGGAGLPGGWRGWLVAGAAFTAPLIAALVLLGVVYALFFAW